MRRRDFLIGSALALAGGCRRRNEREVVVYTSVDQVFSEPIFRDFERASGVRVRAVFDTEETKSTGVLNRLIAESASPLADVFWSGDPVRPFQLVRRNMVEPYRPKGVEEIPLAFRAEDGTWTGIAARARVLIANRRKLEPRPASVRDLADIRFRGRGAIANPLYGTTTMHVAALAVVWGDDALKKFLDDVRANGTKIASSNGEVKRLVVSGEADFGLTDTDDAKEAMKDNPDVIEVLPDQDGLGTLVMPTSVVKLRKSQHRTEANALVDALVAPATEERLAESAHTPLRASLAAKSKGRPLGEINAMAVDYAKVGDAMERLAPWLKKWAGV